MPIDVFYPSAATQPAAAEGLLIEGLGATSWSNLNKAAFDAALNTNDGSLTPPANGVYAPAANEFMRTPIQSVGLGLYSKMFRLSSWLRLGDDASLASVVAAGSTITNVSLNKRTSDADMGLTATSGLGTNAYFFQYQLRTAAGAFGPVLDSNQFFDYAGTSFYFYRTDPIADFFLNLPSAAQLRDAGFGINGRMGFNGESASECSPEMGFNGVRLTIDHTPPGVGVRLSTHPIAVRLGLSL